MQLHHLSSKHRIHPKIRIGRGGKRGTTSGKGTKGQKSRAGRKIRPALRDIIKKLPKLRGRGKHSFRSFRQKPAVVNMALLEKYFKEGDTISPAVLLERGLVRRIKGRTPMVKILGGGEGKKKFVFKDVLFSKSVVAKMK
ncbi:MAG: uL15 family ribosomal protein [bacterium]|nr:uL15 family ribosomal protein [bacterium]